MVDLGCGHTLYGIGFLIYGARSYLGIDPRLELDAPKLRRWERFRTRGAGSSWTLREVEAAVPSVRAVAWATTLEYEPIWPIRDSLP